MENHESGHLVNVEVFISKNNIICFINVIKKRSVDVSYDG